ncbi:UNVERIFIED_CONTAM: hypothetical protein PYX00_009562 [Menopon gallinae]|uniref:RILP-like protein homolog n=1 Tax=Menopon gallinae TaxID=328185 RepID=A0AAW2HBN8_9NEOP
MQENDVDITVVDVYDIASEIGKEFERIIDAHGTDALTNLIPKVIGALEHLESLALRNEKENTTVQDLTARIRKLEAEKVEKAEDRKKFERELEQIEDHWRQESKDLLSVVTRLQEENRRLSDALSDKENSSGNKQGAMTPEVDIAVVQRLQNVIEKQREQIRTKDKELTVKTSELETVTGQLDRLTTIGKELRRKHKITQGQVRLLIDERADFLAQLQDQQREINTLKQNLGLAEKENEDLSKNYSELPDLKNKAIYDLDDPNRPRFTTSELKEILQERNELKARVSDLEDELDVYRPKNPGSENNSIGEEDDAPVQGPLPYEPDDAPWKKASESGIRKFFRKLFNESNITLLGSSPKRSFSTLSKMALSKTATDHDTRV